MKHRSDEELMLEFKGGEESAFREIFTRYKNPVYGFVRRRVSNPSRAEEITQDVFLALVKNRNGYEVRAGFRTYLYRIAINRVTAEYRKRKEEDPLPENPGAAPGSDPVVVTAVREALEQIDDDHREIVLLREYQGLSYDEIASVLGLPVGTVRSRLFRAKMALRELLAPSWVGRE